MLNELAYLLFQQEEEQLDEFDLKAVAVDLVEYAQVHVSAHFNSFLSILGRRILRIARVDRLLARRCWS